MGQLQYITSYSRGNSANMVKEEMCRWGIISYDLQLYLDRIEYVAYFAKQT